MARSQSKLQGAPIGIRPESSTSHRSRSLRVLFVHRDADAIDSCLGELKKRQFVVSADFVLNLEQCAELLRTQSYDVVVAEYPGQSWTETRAAELLRHKVPDTPLIFVTTSMAMEPIPQLAANGACDYVEREHLARLPMAIRRVLSEWKLRQELDGARSALRHSQSLHQALVDNPMYGIYRCGAEGQLLDANRTLATMLGYTSEEQLLTANRESAIIPELRDGQLLSVEASLGTKQTGSVESEWKRKDGTLLRVRLSGRGVDDDNGNCAGHQIIVADITEQRTLEDQLRYQASCDSLTGLANHRRLFDVLRAEISRSERTGREFSLLLLDLDGLKTINDQFGHPTGDRALCRLAGIVKDHCRSIDTAARHGGDEFAVVLAEIGMVSATSVGRRIRDLLEKDAEDPPLSVSVGIANYPHEADTIVTLLQTADRALYAMKSKGSVSSRTATSSYSPSAGSNPSWLGR